MAIQDAMGWDNAHLHDFTVASLEGVDEDHIGIPDDSGFDEFDTKPGWKVKIKKYFTEEGDSAFYEYDFGDSWGHSVELEKVLPKLMDIKYPVCTAGKRACPPEDCGGVWGYKNLLDIIKAPRHEEYESMMEWLGGAFDPEAFNAAEVFFTDPKQRLKYII